MHFSDGNGKCGGEKVLIFSVAWKKEIITNRTNQGWFAQYTKINK